VTALTWDASDKRRYETGVDRGVLYIPTNGVYDQAFAWNGLTTVTESPSGADLTSLYADNIKYLQLQAYEEFGGTVEAYTYPDEFAEMDGTVAVSDGVYVGQQPRKPFGFSYRTLVGNADNPSLGYKVHMVWGALATPSEKAYSSINDSPDAITFSWDFSTVPVAVTGLKPTSYICIDSTKVDSAALATLEGMLYGTGEDDPALPTPDAVLAIFTGSITTTALPTAPTYDSGTDVVTIPTITGVIYYRTGHGDFAGGDTEVIAANTVYRARPATGYKFPATSVREWLIVFS